MLGCCIYTDLSVLFSAARWRADWFVQWLKHLRAGLLFFKKKKQSVECSADSQKVMQCVKAGGVRGGRGGGGGSSVKPWTIQDLSLPNMPSVLNPALGTRSCGPAAFYVEFYLINRVHSLKTEGILSHQSYVRLLMVWLITSLLAMIHSWIQHVYQ